MIFDEIQEELNRQIKLHGIQTHLSPTDWVTILTEEVGEVAKEACDWRFQGRDLHNYRTELIQVAAVAVAAIRCLETQRGALENLD